MAAARHNRPFVMIYGGSIKKGFSKLLNKEINISTCYEAAGAFNYGELLHRFTISCPSCCFQEPLTLRLCRTAACGRATGRAREDSK